MATKITVESLEDVQNQQARLAEYYDTLVAEYHEVTETTPVPADPEATPEVIPTDIVGLITYCHGQVNKVKQLRDQIAIERTRRTATNMKTMMTNLASAIYTLAIPEPEEGEE